MRRLCAASVAAVALLAFTAVPSQAQPDGIGDLPQLGFAIEPHEGFVGDTVEGWVDTDDVAEHCITTPDDFVAEFLDLEDPLGPDSTPYYSAVAQIAEDIFGGVVNPPWGPLEFSYAVLAFFPLGLALDLPSQGGSGELVEDALFQTFVMAFADIETASPHSPRGNFNPFTGEGSTPVPELEPGLYPVIATCVALDQENLTYERMVEVMEIGADYIAENIPEPYPDNPLGEEFAELAGQIAPVLLEELVAPQALGIEFYCILDEDGVCATPPEDLVPADLEDLEAGELEELEDELATEAVTARPAFTG